MTHLLGKTINPKVAYRGSVLAAIDEAYGLRIERCRTFGGLGEDEIEIGDGIKPEDISEEDAPLSNMFTLLSRMHWR